MRTLPLLGVLTGAILSAAAHASSYDLLLIADRGASGVPASVHRYDGTSGRWLGEFARGELVGNVSIQVRPETGEAHILEPVTNSLLVYDYSTGLFKRSLLGISGSELALAPNGDYYTVMGNAIRRYSSTGTLLGSVAPGTGRRFNGIGFLGFGRVVTYANNSGSDSGGRWEFHNADLSGTPLLNFGVSSLLSNLRGFNTAGNRLTFAVNSSFGSSWTFTPDGLTATASDFGTGVNAIQSVAAGHDVRSYAVGKDPANSALGLVGRYDRSTFRGTFGSDRLRDPYSVASVVAPEPGTMLALGAGLAFLARRRRRA